MGRSLWSKNADTAAPLPSSSASVQPTSATDVMTMQAGGGTLLLKDWQDAQLDQPR